MHSFFYLIYLILPIIAAVFLIVGLMKKQNAVISIAVWISLLGLLFHYQISGGEILGHYFNFLTAGIYSFNLLVLLIGIFNLFTSEPSDNFMLKLGTSFLKAFILIGLLVILTNLWINAYFIENRKAHTAIIQVAGMEKYNPCKTSKIAYYKMDKAGNIKYLCPNQYGVFPGIGKLEKIPPVLAKQLPKIEQKK